MVLSITWIFVFNIRQTIGIILSKRDHSILGLPVQVIKVLRVQIKVCMHWFELLIVIVPISSDVVVRLLIRIIIKIYVFRSILERTIIAFATAHVLLLHVSLASSVHRIVHGVVHLVLRERNLGSRVWLIVLVEVTIELLVPVFITVILVKVGTWKLLIMMLIYDLVVWLVQGGLVLLLLVDEVLLGYLELVHLLLLLLFHELLV